MSVPRLSYPPPKFRKGVPWRYQYAFLKNFTTGLPV